MSNMHTTNNVIHDKELQEVTQLVSRHLKQLRYPFRASMAASSESAALSLLSFLINKSREAGREDILHDLADQGLLFRSHLYDVTALNDRSGQKFLNRGAL